MNCGRNESDFDAPTPVGLDLYPHQRAFCEFASIGATVESSALMNGHRQNSFLNCFQQFFP